LPPKPWRRRALQPRAGRGFRLCQGMGL
jgi:hypothetical protein